MTYIDENVSFEAQTTPEQYAANDIPIGRNLSTSTGDGLRYAPYTASAVPWLMADVDALAVAMRKGGNTWFFGRDIRSAEQARLVSHDLFVALDIIGYSPQLKIQRSGEEQPTFEEMFPDSVGTTGQAGNSR